MLERLRRLFRVLELHVGVALRRMRAHPFSGPVDLSNPPEGGEYLPDVLPGHLPGEPREVHFSGLRGGAAPSARLLVSSGWLGFGTGPPPVVSGRQGLGEPAELELGLRGPLERPERPDAESELESRLEPARGRAPEPLPPPEAPRRFRALSLPRCFSPDCWVVPASLQRSADCSSERSLRGMGDGVISPPRSSASGERGVNRLKSVSYSVRYDRVL